MSYSKIDYNDVHFIIICNLFVHFMLFFFVFTVFKAVGNQLFPHRADAFLGKDRP